jgi:hypothetical protein
LSIFTQYSEKIEQKLYSCSGTARDRDNVTEGKKINKMGLYYGDAEPSSAGHFVG